MSGEAGDTAQTGHTWNWRTIALVVMAVLGVGVLVALIATLGQANSERDRALARRNHSFEVMILARTLSGTIARSEASLGRYVISGDRSLGQLYYDEWRLAKQQLDRLDQITDDNADQTPALARLRRAYETRGDELSLIALSTNYGKNSQALARYYQARQAPALATINRTLDIIIRRERTLLEQRTGAALATIDRSATAATVLSVFGILLVIGAIVLGWLTTKAMTERAAAQAEAESERERAEELALAVTAATNELRAQEARLRQVQKMEAVGQLTGGIAHDFNNMLAVVLGGLELAKRNIRDKRSAAARHIDSATEGANRAAALTRQLLAFAREEKIALAPVDAGALIAGMRDLLDRTLGDAVSVAVVDHSRGWRVRADHVQLENAVLNLAVNARDAMNGRGHLTIVTGATTLVEGEHGHNAAGDHLTIAVTDTGCGMEAAVVERVFEPFFTTKPIGKGTGLGLSQIFGFVRQLGGEIGIVSAPGAGTTVTLYLPRDLAEAQAVPPVELVAAVEPAATKLVVLVVEDDPRVLAATMGALEELGHHAIACDDPLAAPAMLDAHPNIDLIISDVLMPHQTGPEMIAALDPRHAHVAVLFVTGFAGEAGDGAALGDHHVLRKPFTLAGLERSVEAAMAADRPVLDRVAAE